MLPPRPRRPNDSSELEKVMAVTPVDRHVNARRYGEWGATPNRPPRPARAIEVQHDPMASAAGAIKCKPHRRTISLHQHRPVARDGLRHFVTCTYA